MFAEEAEEAPERSGNLDQTAALEVKEAKKRVIKVYLCICCLLNKENGK